MSTVTLGNSDGSNDNTQITNAINSAVAGSGPAVVMEKPGQEYRINSLSVTSPVALGLSTAPASGSSGSLMTISSSDVHLLPQFNMDMKNQNNLHTGIDISNGSNGFRAYLGTTGTFKNLQSTATTNASFIHPRSLEDFEVHGGIMRDGYSVNTACRGFYFNPGSSGARTLKDVLISGMKCYNLQSSNNLEDAEFCIFQGYAGSNHTVTGKGAVIRGCYFEDGGKRFVKFQTGGGHVYNNECHWKTKTGPLGTRQMRCFVFCASGDNEIRNNHFETWTDRSFNAIVDITADQYVNRVNTNEFSNNYVNIRVPATDGGQSEVVFYYQEWQDNGRSPFPFIFRDNTFEGPANALLGLHKFNSFPSGINASGVTESGNTIDPALYSNRYEIIS